MTRPAPRMTPPEGERLRVAVSRATAADVEAIRDLLLRHFGYIYVTLLGDSEELASGILAPILKANRGRHSLGYRSFHVARPEGAGRETAGILKMTTRGPAERWGALVSALSVIRLVLQNLGPRGALRTLRTWWVIRGITPAVAANELHVMYLAVADDAVKRQVGKQLLEYAKAFAAREGKEFISLYVRARNLNAQGFFLSQGFSVEGVVTDAAADGLLKQGPSIRMTAAAQTPAGRA